MKIEVTGISHKSKVTHQSSNVAVLSDKVGSDDKESTQRRRYGLMSKKEANAKKKVSAKRRPSFEIAEDYIELNFKPLIDVAKEAEMPAKERKKLEKAKRKQEKKANKVRHPVRNAIIGILVLSCMAIASGYWWWKTSNLPVDAKKTATYQFVVDQGATSDQVAVALKKAGFIRNELAFKFYVRLNGNVIQAGTHVLSPSYNLHDVVERLAKPVSDEKDIQIPPGLTLNQLKDVFRKYDYTDAEIETALSAHYDSDILADKPAEASLEGYLYPDTYRIYNDDDLGVVINKALKQFSDVAQKNYLKAKFASHGLSVYQGITLASIVTREVSNETDQKMVAGVFYNRIANGMQLGSDVTFQYAYKQGLCTENTPNCDSPYNTRLNAGLPPGPIANPTLSALKAVAEPTDSNYLYFVAGDDGKTYYSETADQHNQAVAQHCTTLCQ